MKPKRYRIKDGILRFADGLNTFEDYINIPEGVFFIDFNDVKHIKKPLRLEHTKIKEINFKNVLTVDNVYLPENCIITENLYYANKIIAPLSTTIKSQRLRYLNVYDNRNLIYLSGTVSGYLAIRHQQRFELIDAGFAVYSPGNHITFGDENAEKYPELVAEIDFLMLERCDIMLFDLNNLSPGTCAELGFALGANYHKTKKLYYFGQPTKNFFINGVTKHMKKVNDLEDFIRLYKAGKL